MFGATIDGRDFRQQSVDVRFSNVERWRSNIEHYFPTLEGRPQRRRPVATIFECLTRMSDFRRHIRRRFWRQSLLGAVNLERFWADYARDFGLDLGR
jgi:hypothetical protein